MYSCYWQKIYNFLRIETIFQTIIAHSSSLWGWGKVTLSDFKGVRLTTIYTLYNNCFSCWDFLSDITCMSCIIVKIILEPVTDWNFEVVAVAYSFGVSNVMQMVWRQMVSYASGRRKPSNKIVVKSSQIKLILILRRRLQDLIRFCLSENI